MYSLIYLPAPPQRDMLMKKKLIRPTAAEDAAITKAALSDPDSPPITDEEWSKIKHRLFHGRARATDKGIINKKSNNTV